MAGVWENLPSHSQSTPVGEFPLLAECRLSGVQSGCVIAELDQRLDQSGGQFEIVDA